MVMIMTLSSFFARHCAAVARGDNRDRFRFLGILNVVCKTNICKLLLLLLLLRHAVLVKDYVVYVL